MKSHLLQRLSVVSWLSCARDGASALAPSSPMSLSVGGLDWIGFDRCWEECMVCEGLLIRFGGPVNCLCSPTL